MRTIAGTLILAAALASSSSAVAQTAATDAKHAQPSMMEGKHGDPKSECQAMMSKKQEMNDKLQAMDAALDKLVAEMNTAAPGAREKPMLAVIIELVADRKAERMMMMDLQSSMMAHMMRHMQSKDPKSGCPMMQMEKKQASSLDGPAR